MNEINKIIYLSKLKYNVIQQIKSKSAVDKKAESKVTDGLLKLKKWDDFRARRKVAIDKYLKAKRKQKGLQELLRIAFTLKALRKSFNIIAETRAYNHYRLQAAMISMKMMIKFSLKLRKCRHIPNKHRCLLRSIFTLIGQLADPSEF